MKNYIPILLLTLLPNYVCGQNLDFNVIVLDTSLHFNPSRYARARLDSNIVIDNDSICKEVFRWSPFTVGRPKFSEAIWLKRTIRGTCLTKVENSVTIDSTKRTVTWNTIVESANCRSKDTRHIVIQIPTPPNDFEVLFDATFLENRQEPKITKIDTLEVSSFVFNPIIPFNFIDSSGIITNNDSLFTYLKKVGIHCEKADFRKKLILVSSYGGDCLMHLMPHVFFDRITNTMVLNVYNIWGGCRAGGRKSIAILVERPKENFNIVFQEIQVESWSEYRQDINKMKK